MAVFSRSYIVRYVSSFSDTPQVQGFLQAALVNNLLKDKRYLSLVENPNDLPSEKLKKKFRNKSRAANQENANSKRQKKPITPSKRGQKRARKMAREDWYLFKETPLLSENINRFAAWLEREFMQIPDDRSRLIRRAVLNKLGKHRSIDAAFEQIGHPLITEREIAQALTERTVTPEEKKQQMRHIASLGEGYNLFQIMTANGMIEAGEKAHNCLGSKKLPLNSTPHRYRVLKPDRWLYFTIRDADNHSVATIGVDRKYGKVSYEGNHQEPLHDEYYPFIATAKNAIQQLYPDVITKRPYGTYQHFSHQSLA